MEMKVFYWVLPSFFQVFHRFYWVSFRSQMFPFLFFLPFFCLWDFCCFILPRFRLEFHLLSSFFLLCTWTRNWGTPASFASGFYRVLLGFTRPRRVETEMWVLRFSPSGFTGFYRVLTGSPGCYWILPSFTALYRVFQCFIEWLGSRFILKIPFWPTQKGAAPFTLSSDRKDFEKGRKKNLSLVSFLFENPKKK